MTDWRDEKARVREALAILLPTLEHPHLVVPLGLRLAGLTGLPEKRCRTVLGWLAHEGHPHATHDGGVVRSYGREVTRWRWHSTPQRASQAETLVVEQTAAYRAEVEARAARYAQTPAATEDW